MTTDAFCYWLKGYLSNRKITQKNKRKIQKELNKILAYGESDQYIDSYTEQSPVKETKQQSKNITEPVGFKQQENE